MTEKPKKTIRTSKNLQNQEIDLKERIQRQKNPNPLALSLNFL